MVRDHLPQPSTTKNIKEMKLVKHGEDYIILSDADVAIQVIKQSEVIDGDAVLKEKQLEAKYAKRAAAMSNEKLLEMFATSVLMRITGGITLREDHDIMATAICSEILKRMNK